MKWFVAIALVLSAVAVLEAQPGSRAEQTMEQGSAATYESLATAIIAIRETETNLVKGILDHSYYSAQGELSAALGAQGGTRASHLEAAARDITFVAEEGDKRIQAIRQRLLDAGHHHHHHAEADTQDDYIFINAAEKKALLDLANKTAKLGPNASDDDIKGVMKDLTGQFDAATKAE